MGSEKEAMEAKLVPFVPYMAGTSLIEDRIIPGFIILLLASIVFPVFSVARQKARQSSCASNLKMTGLALLGYMEDYDGMSLPLPKTTPDNKVVQAQDAPTWCDLLIPYMDGGFRACPDRVISSIWAAERKDKPQVSGYAYNGNLVEAINLSGNSWPINNKPAPVGTSAKCIRRPELTVALFEARVGTLVLNAPDVDKEGANPTPGAIRHRGGANYLFADGHVKWFEPKRLRLDKRGDAVHPGFGL